MEDLCLAKHVRIGPKWFGKVASGAKTTFIFPQLQYASRVFNYLFSQGFDVRLYIFPQPPYSWPQMEPSQHQSQSFNPNT